MCGEDNASEQIRDPNAEQVLENPLEAPMIDVCWDCKMYIKWSKLHMITHSMGETIKPFPDWLFETEGVYPKNNEYIAAVIEKKKNICEICKKPYDVYPIILDANPMSIACFFEDETKPDGKMRNICKECRMKENGQHQMD